MRNMLLALACVTAFTSPAAAQEKTTTFVLPYIEGSATNNATRIVVEGMKKYWQGGPLIIEPHPGAGGGIAMQYCEKAAPDGFTVCIGGLETLVQAPAIREKQLYNVDNFRPIGLMVRQPLLLAIRSDIPAHTMGEFIAYAKSKGDALNYGSAGVGSGSHIAIEQLNATLKITPTHVPYKGSPEAMQDLLGGRIDYTALYAGAAVGHKNSGKVRFIAVLGPTAVELFPDVPIFAGVNLFYWSMPVVPIKTPQDIVDKLNGAMRSAVHTDPDTVIRLKNIGVQAPGSFEMSVNYAEGYLARSRREDGKILKDLGIVIPQ